MKNLLKLMLIVFISVPLFGQQFNFISDTITTKSGLKYLKIEEGKGEKVTVNKEVAFHWTGYFQNGKSFGTSIGGEPFYYITGKGQVIKGAEEGLALMKVGDRNLFIVPPKLAYGEKGAGETIPPNSTLVFDYKVVSVENPKLSLVDTMKHILDNAGVEKSIELYKKLKKENYENYPFRESTLNGFGYRLMQQNKLKEALEIFKLNAEEYPNSWNVFDSLGEIYLLLGNEELGIKNYKKSLQLNPENGNAREIISKKIKEKK